MKNNINKINSSKTSDTKDVVKSIFTKALETKEIITRDKFRLNAKSLFLTYLYDEHKLTISAIINMIREKLSNVEWYIISEEGTNADYLYRHCHVLISGSKPFDIKTHNFLDINNVHGNYQTSKNILKVYDYITKENTWNMYSDIMSQEQIDSVVHNFSRKLFTKQRVATDDKFYKYLYNAVCINKDITKVEQELRKILKQDSINVNDLKFLIQTIKNKNLYDELKNLLAQNVNRLTKPIFVHRSYLIFIYLWLSKKNKYGDPYTLFIQGSPGIGKTSIIQHLVGEEGLFIQHNDMLKSYSSNEHKYIIYDDINTKGIDRSILIQMTDSEQNFQADVKNSMVIVSHKTTRLMVSNEKIDKVFPSKDGAIARRLYKCHINYTKSNDINTSLYSDVFGDDILIYFKSDISSHYNITINLKDKKVVEFDSNLAEELLDKGEKYIQLNYGLLTHYKNNLHALELLLYGSKHDINRIKFDLAKDILAKQIKYKSYHIPNEDMEALFNIHVEDATCICGYATTAALNKQTLDCFVCWAKKFVKDKSFWKKLFSSTSRF